MTLIASHAALVKHPGDDELTIDTSDSNEFGSGGWNEQAEEPRYQPTPLDYAVFSEIQMAADLREAAKNVQARHPQLNLLMSYSAGAAFDAGGTERQHAINFHATAYDLHGFNQGFDAGSLPELADAVCRRYAEVLASRNPAPRFTVEHGPGFGPDGSDLFNVVDATKDAPENVVDYRSDHPRMSGRLAKVQAEELAAEQNRDAAEVGEFVVPALCGEAGAA